MNTLNQLTIDLDSGVVTGSLPDLEKVGNDLIFQVIFQRNGSNFYPAPIVSSIVLTLKSTATGEIVLQSDASDLSQDYPYVHATISGSPLGIILSNNAPGSAVDLIGELQYVLANPLHQTPNAGFGPATLKISSQNFTVSVSGALG
jgi:hypothetical protein